MAAINILFERKPLFLEKPDAMVDDCGVIEDALVLSDLRDGLINPVGGPVRPVGGHGLDDVGDDEDVGFREDGAAFEAGRIAAAVKAFMVLNHNIGDGPWEAEDLVVEAPEHILDVPRHETLVFHNQDSDLGHLGISSLV
jgi:hypothetical protein